MLLHGKLVQVAVASRWLLNFFFLNSNDDLDAVLSTDLKFKFVISTVCILKKTKIILFRGRLRKRFVACGFCGVKISHVIGYNTINIPDIF